MWWIISQQCGLLEEPQNGCDSQSKISLSNERPDDRLMLHQYIHASSALFKCFNLGMIIPEPNNRLYFQVSSCLCSVYIHNANQTFL